MSSETAIPSDLIEIKPSGKEVPTAKESAADGAKLNLLQALRGVAAIAVVCYHANELDNSINGSGFSWWKPILALGWMGVDCFFCLSGFIITWVHDRDIGIPNRGKQFILKRFIRIYPPLFILIVLKCLLILTLYLTHSPHALSNPIGRGFRAFFILPAIHDAPLIITEWTLTYEVFFYGLFCIAILMGKRFVLIGTAIWAATIVLYNLAPSDLPNSESTSFVFNPYNLEFLGGAVAAYFARRQTSLSFIVILFAFACGSLGMAMGFHLILITHSLQYIGPNWLAQKMALTVFFSLLILLLTQLEIIRKLSVSKVFVFLGAASYSIYLLHDEAIAHMDPLVTKWLHPLPWVHIPLLVMTAVVLGVIYYLTVEKPLLRKCRLWLIPKS